MRLSAAVLPTFLPVLVPGVLIALLAGACGRAEEGSPESQAGAAAEAPRGGQGLVVENPTNPARPRFHDLGTVQHGEKREHLFELRNHDREEVTILSAQGACGCTKVTRLRLTQPEASPVDADLGADELLRIPPGGRVEFVVRVDTTKIRANIDKLAVMRVRTSSPNTPFLDFELHIKGLAPFTLEPDEIRIGNIPRSFGGAGQTTIMTGVRGGKALIVDIVEHSERVEPTLEYLFVNGEHVWTLTVRILENQELGPLTEVVTLSTTDDEGEGEGGRLAVTTWAQVVEDITFEPRLMQFTAFASDAGAELPGRLHALVPGMRLKILGAKIETEHEGHFDVTLEPVAPHADGSSFEWKVQLSAQPGLPAGRFDGVIKLETDDSQYPEVSVAFLGVVL